MFGSQGCLNQGLNRQSYFILLHLNWSCLLKSTFLKSLVIDLFTPHGGWSSWASFVAIRTAQRSPRLKPHGRWPFHLLDLVDTWAARFESGRGIHDSKVIHAWSTQQVAVSRSSMHIIYCISTAAWQAPPIDFSCFPGPKCCFASIDGAIVHTKESMSLKHRLQHPAACKSHGAFILLKCFQYQYLHTKFYTCCKHVQAIASKF